MPDSFYSTSDLSRRSGDIIAEALRRPVIITQRNKPRLVVMAYEDYKDLLAGDQTPAREAAPREENDTPVVEENKVTSAGHRTQRMFDEVNRAFADIASKTARRG